jgi:hypothetical protein
MDLDLIILYESYIKYKSLKVMFPLDLCEIFIFHHTCHVSPAVYVF